MYQDETLDDIEVLLAQGQVGNAQLKAQLFCDAHPGDVDGWIMLGRISLERKLFAKALEAGERAVALMPKDITAQLLHLDGLFRCGMNAEAFEVSKRLLAEKRNDAMVNKRIGNFFTRTNRHAEAARCYERVRVLSPADHSIIYNLVSARIALGQLDDAAFLFDDLLRKDPDEYPAYYTRATLQKWTAEKNHVGEMEKILGHMPAGHLEEPTLCYSLAKELEDMKEWPRAFSYLKRGADARRKLLSTYDVQGELDLMEEVKEHFNEAYLGDARAGFSQGSPIFVLGMPRSGTTLVDRIISSHPLVGSVGESKEFGRVLSQLGHERYQQEIVDVPQACALEPHAIGEAFWVSIKGLLPGYERLLDKTPRNFMHLGHILKALPNAKIIHLRRHPIDSCYAVYKTLFRDGYLFSYDLEDLGRFYLGYLDLMAHWRRVLPGRFLDVDYEALVENQEAVTRQMIDFCGLEWNEACLSFEKNASPTLTASAAQVRQPIYKSSVALWRRYEKELDPLIRVLEAGGVKID